MSSKVARVINLFNAITGESLGKQDAGEGIRQKAWLDEVPQWSLFAAQQQSLGVGGVGRLTNFPAFIEGGREFESNPIGQASPKSTYNGHVFHRALGQTAVLGVGDGTVVTFGSEALTTTDVEAEDWRAVDAGVGGQPVPRGASVPPFYQSDDQANFSSAAGTLSIVINGSQYNVAIGASATAASIADAIRNAGVPVGVAIATVNATVRLRILGHGRGVTATLQVLSNTLADSIFPAATATVTPVGTLVRGDNGPLGQVDNEDAVAGGKPQRRILPGSVNILMTAAGEVITVTDINRDGVLTGQNAAATVTVAGTIDYVTGAVTVTMTGDAPDAATNVQGSWKALVPLNLEEPVRIPVGGMDLAVELA